MIEGADPDLRADYFKTYVKAYIYCEKPMPSGADSVPGSTSYQYNVVRKYSPTFSHSTKLYNYIHLYTCKHTGHRLILTYSYMIQYYMYTIHLHIYFVHACVHGSFMHFYILVYIAALSVA